MERTNSIRRHAAIVLPAAAALTLFTAVTAHAQTELRPGSMHAIADVDPRFVSFNIEAVEVTGGNFWKPYRDEQAAPAKPAAEAKGAAPGGVDPSRFQYRAPIDLANAKLRTLASGLAPSFVRVSGTWRNTTFFQNDDQPARATPPQGYRAVMTRAQWKGVLDFARATHADVVTSVATGEGTRDASGVWTPAQAKEVFDYTKSVGGHIAATEFMNEPTFAAMGGAPKGYNAEAYARDVKVFAAFLRKESPDTVLLGPGSVGEGVTLMPGAGPMPGFISTEQMMRATGPVYDAFSYHFYPAVSRRCAPPEKATKLSQLLTEEWLGRNVKGEEFYAHERDQYLPGKAMWLTETGEAACGGDPWASEFVDSFRFADQLGSLAQKGVKTVMVNTLAASDYGLLDERTLEPRPDYWVALLWKRLMGTRVLDPGVTAPEGTRVYAQCSNQPGGGVTMAVLNLGGSQSQAFSAPVGGERYALTSGELESTEVALNGAPLKVGADGSLPQLHGERFAAGKLALAPHSVNFLVFPDAKNTSCGKR